jgi:phage terminase small subunit
MSALKDIREERYAQFVARGLPRPEAYRKAGFKARNPSRQDLYHMLSKPRIKARVAEIVAKAAAANDVTVERIIKELALIAFANLHDYMTIGPDGQPSLDWENLTRDQAAALQEVTTEDTEFGRKTKFKLSDKQQALLTLGKRFGLWGPDYSINNALIVNQRAGTQDAAQLERILIGIIEARNKQQPVIEHNPAGERNADAAPPPRLVEPPVGETPDTTGRTQTTTEAYFEWANRPPKPP